MLGDGGGQELAESMVAVQAVEHRVDPAWGVGAVDLGE